jgi:hypothetical protein
LNKLIVIFLIAASNLFSQGDFLTNFYNRDFKVSKTDILQLLASDPSVVISKDSANILEMKGNTWQNYSIKRIDIIFVNDTVGNFFMLLQDTSDVMNSFNCILEKMQMQFGRSKDMIRYEDESFIKNRHWIKYSGVNIDSILQLSVTKANPSKIFIAYMNISRLEKL